MIRASSPFIATCRYEFLMQLRRRALWITIGVGVLTLFVLLLQGEQTGFLPAPSMTAYVILGIGQYFPIVFGILLADRVQRDDRLGIAELVDSLPVTEGERTWGRYVGAGAATVAPLAAGYLILVLAFAIKAGDTPMVLDFLPVFSLIALPGLLFVAAFSLAFTRLLPTPIYAILFSGYWFWGNFAQSHVPNPSCGPLAPIGRYISAGLFDTDGARGCALTQHHVGWWGAATSYALLFSLGLGALLALHAYDRWRRTTQ